MCILSVYLIKDQIIYVNINIIIICLNLYIFTISKIFVKKYFKLRIINQK